MSLALLFDTRIGGEEKNARARVISQARSASAAGFLRISALMRKKVLRASGECNSINISTTMRWYFGFSPNANSDAQPPLRKWDATAAHNPNGSVILFPTSFGRSL